MSLEIKRPKGVTVFVILGILDAIAMAVFMGMFFGTPELYWELFDDQSQIDFGQDYAISKFNDMVLEGGIFVIVVDAVGVIALLSAKKVGRKVVIGCAVSGIAFNIIIFGIPGLIANSILLWYMFRANTKQYFELRH